MFVISQFRDMKGFQDKYSQWKKIGSWPYKGGTGWEDKLSLISPQSRMNQRRSWWQSMFELKNITQFVQNIQNSLKCVTNVDIMTTYIATDCVLNQKSYIDFRKMHDYFPFIERSEGSWMRSWWWENDEDIGVSGVRGVMYHWKLPIHGVVYFK